MTKQEYLTAISGNPLIIVYKYYLEMFEQKKHIHKNEISMHNFNLFFQQFGLYGVIQDAVKTASEYYEIKFHINRLYNKEGRLIWVG